MRLLFVDLRPGGHVHELFISIQIPIDKHNYLERVSPHCIVQPFHNFFSILYNTGHSAQVITYRNCVLLIPLIFGQITTQLLPIIAGMPWENLSKIRHSTFKFSIFPISSSYVVDKICNVHHKSWIHKSSSVFSLISIS